jgi:hypothetical protein
MKLTPKLGPTGRRVGGGIKRVLGQREAGLEVGAVETESFVKGAGHGNDDEQ